MCRDVAVWTCQAQDATFPRKEAKCSPPDIHTPSPSPLSGFCSDVMFSTRPSQITSGMLEPASTSSGELTYMFRKLASWLVYTVINEN